MKSVSGKEFAKVLERHGWSLLRIQGSHQIYGKNGTDVRLSVPVHGNQALKIGLLRHLMRWRRSTKMIFNLMPHLTMACATRPQQDLPLHLCRAQIPLR